MAKNTETVADDTTARELLDELHKELDETLLIKAQGMNIKQYVPAPKIGHYDEQVKTLLELNESTGFDNLIPILVPAADAKKHKRWFKESAAAHNKGARVVNGEEGQPQGDGGVLFEFILTEPRKVNRKSKDEDAASDSETETAPAAA